jgi:hypothetical protein
VAPPAEIRIVSPSKPTTTTPAAFDRVVSDAMQALSNTVIELAALRVGRKL